MTRHELDLMSLVAGVVFVILGLGLLLDAGGGINFDARWVWPILLIGLGAAGLASSVRRR